MLLSPINAQSPSSSQPQSKLDGILVKFKNKPESEVTKFEPGDNLETVLSQFREDPSVEFAEPNYLYNTTIIPSDTHFNNQWYLQKIHAASAWNETRESVKTTIAIIDTGIQTSHPDLKDNIWVNKKEIASNGIDDDRNGFIDDVNGWNFVDGNNNPDPKFDDYTDDVMHGTIIAGIAAASGNNAAGIAGITWKTSIMPLKALNDKGEGNSNNVIRAIDYAVANNADIINLSFVGTGYSRGMDEAVKRAYDAGIIIVAAAGNESTKSAGHSLSDAPMYPVCLDGRPHENRIIGVAATDTMDQKTAFSSFGSRCVDIAAPGVSIFSTVVYSPTNSLKNQILDKHYDGYWSGTSVATPIISGALALIEATNPRLTRSEAIGFLLGTADNINRLNPNFLNQLGSGRVNLDAAINSVKAKLEQSIHLLLIATNSGKASTLKITEGDGTLLSEFNPFPNFSGSTSLAATDVDSDGKAEIIAGAGAGGGPHVKIFDMNGKVKGQFFAFNSNFRGGVNLAVGDVDGDGKAEIIAGAGAGGGPQVKIFNGKGELEGQFFAYSPDFRGGVRVTVGDIDGGTVHKRSEIITAPGTGAMPEVKIFTNQARLVSKFSAFNSNFRNGITVTASDIDMDGLDEIATAAGPGGAPHVRTFEADGKLLNSFYAYDAEFKGGITIGSYNQY